MVVLPEAISSGNGRGSDKPLAEGSALMAFSQELAERVKSETLSRWSMQETLRARFPSVPEDILVQSMQEALRLTLNEEGGS
jgi:hypothetical protein